MKRFTFPLEQVLAFRRQQQEAAAGRLRSLATEQKRLEIRAEGLREASLATRAAWLNAAAIDALELRTAYEYAAMLLRHREGALSSALAVQSQRQEQIGRVLEARRRVRLLEMLRRRRRAVYDRRAEREWEALAAELHLARLGRPTTENS